MTKDVMISIRGMHFDLTDNGDNIEIIQPGQYYTRGDTHYLIYEEPVEGTDQTNKNMIKFNDTSMTLTKKGVINTSLLFDTSKKNLTNYVTPYGNLVIGLDTHTVSVTKTDDEINLKINYSLDVNYEFLADCDISIIAHDINSARI